MLTLVGLIHAEEVHVFSNPKIALGYGLAAVVCLGYAALRLPPREIDLRDPIDVEVAAGDAARCASSARRNGWLSRLEVGGLAAGDFRRARCTLVTWAPQRSPTSPDSQAEPP